MTGKEWLQRKIKRTWAFRKQPLHLAGVLTRQETSKDEAESIFWLSHSTIQKIAKLAALPCATWPLCALTPAPTFSLEAEAAIVNCFHISNVTPAPITGPLGLPSSLCFHGRLHARHVNAALESLQEMATPGAFTLSGHVSTCVRARTDHSLHSPSWPEDCGETSPEILLK